MLLSICAFKCVILHLLGPGPFQKYIVLIFSVIIEFRKLEKQHLVSGKDLTPTIGFSSDWRCSAALLHGSSSLPLPTSLPVESQHCETGLCLNSVDSLYSAAFCTTLFNLDLYLVCSLTNLVSFPLFFPLTCFFLYFLWHLHLHAHVIIS